MANIHSIASILQQVVTSISQCTNTYYWQLVGSTPECLCYLLDLDDISWKHSRMSMLPT